MPSNRTKRIHARMSKTGETWQFAARHVDESRHEEESYQKGVLRFDPVLDLMGIDPAESLSDIPDGYVDLFELLDSLAEHVRRTGATVYNHDDPKNKRIGFSCRHPFRWWISTKSLGPSLDSHPDRGRAELVRELLRTQEGRARLVESIPGQRVTARRPGEDSSMMYAHVNPVARAGSSLRVAIEQGVRAGTHDGVPMGSTAVRIAPGKGILYLNGNVTVEIRNPPSQVHRVPFVPLKDDEIEGHLFEMVHFAVTHAFREGRLRGCCCTIEEAPTRLRRFHRQLVDGVPEGS